MAKEREMNRFFEVDLNASDAQKFLVYTLEGITNKLAISRKPTDKTAFIIVKLPIGDKADYSKYDCAKEFTYKQIKEETKKTKWAGDATAIFEPKNKN